MAVRHNLNRGCQRKCSAAIVQRLELRHHLTAVIFGESQNILAAGSAAVAPVVIDLNDVNSDAQPDLIVANDQSDSVGNSISILTGRRDGTFTAGQTIPLDFKPASQAEGIIGAGARLSIVVGSADSGVVGIAANSGGGSFGASHDYVTTGLANTFSITLGDFNHDNRLDIAAVSNDAVVASGVPNVALLLNNGDGTFRLGQELTINATHLSGLVAFKPMQAGELDLAITEKDTSSVQILANDGSGTFRLGQSITVGTAPTSIATADFDGNGSADLAVADSGGGSITLLPGNGDGLFAAPIDSPVPNAVAGAGPTLLRVANMNSDQFPDLLVIPGPDVPAADVLLGNGGGSFHVGSVTSLGYDIPTGIAGRDLNNDGLTDLVISTSSGASSLLNITQTDHTLPTTTLAVTQPEPVNGTRSISFSITYTDDHLIDATTFADGNVSVQTANGATVPVLLQSSGLGNDSSLTVTYAFTAPSGSVSAADDGSYTIVATSDTAEAVKDANGNAVAAGAIGALQVATPATRGLNLTVGALRPATPPAVISGSKARGFSLDITNAGTSSAKGSLNVRLYASASNSIVAGNALLLTQTTQKINVRSRGRVTMNFPAFTWPSGAKATYFLAAVINVNRAIIETIYQDDTRFSSAITIAQPYFDIQNNWNKAFHILKVGKPIRLVIAIQNIGNFRARGKATVRVFASPNLTASGTLLLSQQIRVGLPAGKKGFITVSLKLPASLHSAFHPAVDVELAGDGNLRNDTAASAITY